MCAINSSDSEGIKGNLNLDRFEFNLASAKNVCMLIYNCINPAFETLNKPTHSEMIFKPKHISIPGFQKMDLFNNEIDIGIRPPSNPTWQIMAQLYGQRFNIIRTKAEKILEFEKECLTSIFDSSE